MQILLNVPDEYKEEFLHKFVPSFSLFIEMSGAEPDRDMYMEFTADLEQVYTDNKNHSTR